MEYAITVFNYVLLCSISQTLCLLPGMNRRVTRQASAILRLYPGLRVPEPEPQSEPEPEPDEATAQPQQEPDIAVREVLQAAVDAVIRAEPPPSVSVTKI